MEVKSYNHQSIAEWSNSKLHSELIACAQINPDQNGLYNLDILSLDLSDRSKNLNVMGNAFYNVPFRCLAWDTFGEKENTFSHGVIFGGMEDGSYTLWNAGQMISNYGRNQIVKTEDNIENQPSFLYGEQAEEGSYPIMCAEWNSLKNNYLAFGATDLLILDIGKDISEPQIKKPGNRNPHEGSYITSVAWNKEVANILASASQNGLIALWDIKSNKSIFEFKDSPSSNVGNRNVVICWSKTISTQLAVTLDDEKRNELQIWDLRNQKGPVAVFDRGHTKGINTMQWCETDPDLILTAGRDNKIVCWNYTQEDAPISTQQLNQPVFDLKWSKKLRSIYSLALEDKIQIYTMDNANLFSYVPKWYRVPIQSSFCGNESLIKYSQSEGQKLTEIKLSTLPQAQSSNIHSLLKQLEAAFDETSLEEKSKQSEFWNLIAIKNSNLGDEAIYDFLGFTKEKIIKEVQKYTGKKRGNYHEKTETQAKTKSKAYTPVIGQEAASFFASIGDNQLKNSRANDSDNEQNESVKYDMVPRNFNWNIGKQRLIKHNILIGNYEGAIDAALKCGRTAEALIIAYSLDQNAFNSTLKTFFTETTDNFITDILKNITYRDNEELVKKYDLQSWKECVAMIHSLSTSDKRKALLNLLASRIREESLRKTGKSKDEILPEDNPAIQCYVLSENFNQIANLYYDNLKNFESGTTQRKQAVLEYSKRLILVFNSLSIEIQPAKNFHKIARQAAFIATEENFKMVAYLLFSNFLYETSMKQVDMIIHATKNLEEYRNSVVFKQINIPVMQFKETHQQQQQAAQKGKKTGHQQNPNAQNAPQFNQPGNPNVPTKDKNVPRPPIFGGKREEEKQSAQRPGTVPPPPFSQNRPRTQTPVYEQEEEQVQVPKKNPAKKVPPPPGMKAPQRVNEQPSFGSQRQYQQETSQTSLQMPEKKAPLPPAKGKKLPPPPPTGFITQQPRDQPTLTQHSQPPSKPTFPRPAQNTRVPPPPMSHQQKTPPPPPSHQQQTRVPPPTRPVKQPPPSYHHQQQQEQQEDVEQQQYTQQPMTKSQQFYPQQQQTHHVAQQKPLLKTPPPPASNRIPPPPPAVKQQSYERQEHNTSFQSQRGHHEAPSFNKPEVQSAKKTMPPPPPVSNRRQVVNHSHIYEEEPEVAVNSRTRIEPVTSVIKPPPPPGKIGGNKLPPPPLANRVEQPPVQVHRQPVHNQQAPQQQHFQQFGSQQHSQQFPQQQYNQRQQQDSYEQPQQQQRQQYEKLVIERPPPPMSVKKGPPPPPPRR